MKQTLASFAICVIMVGLIESNLPTVAALASPEHIELAYDDGIAEEYWYKTAAGVGGYDAVRFTPPSQLRYSRIVGVKYYLKSPSTFNIVVLDDNREILYDKQGVPRDIGWFAVDLHDANIIVRGDFYAAMRWTVAERPWLGADESNPDGRSFLVDGGAWRSYPMMNLIVEGQAKDGDFMIRAIVEEPQDSDSDGLYDFEEAKLGTNPNNPDTDGDGLNDADEIRIYKTDPLKADTDGDGLGDRDEVKINHTDPLLRDSDLDGLSDGDEVLKHGTNPLDKDSDSDGLDDGTEIAKGTNPKAADSDSDGLTDGAELATYKTDPLKADTDGDGLKDGDEVKKGTNPLLGDTDGDSWNDSMDMAPLDALVPNVPIGVLAAVVAIVLVAWRLLMRRRARAQPAGPAVAPAPLVPLPPAVGHCASCGSEIPLGVAFCTMCGAQQAANL